LRDLDEDIVTFLPFFPHAFAPSVQVPGIVSGRLKEALANLSITSELDRRSQQPAIFDRIDLRFSCHTWHGLGLDIVRYTTNP
jgi:hypothetical protein